MEYVVSFEIITEKYTLDEISGMLGCEYSSGSTDKGKTYRNRLSDKTVWKLFSGADKNASLVEHCRSIFCLIPSENIISAGILTEECELVTNIGVFYDADRANCSICIPWECMDILSAVQPKIEISYYPCKG